MGIGKFEYSRLHLVCRSRCINDKNIKLNPNRDVHSSFSEGVHLNKTNKQTYKFVKLSKTFDTMCISDKSIGS